MSSPGRFRAPAPWSLWTIKGINVAQDTDLRKQFRDASVDYSVVKNTLTRFAANKAGYTEFDELLNGTTSMASTTEDPIAPARVICEFAKKNKNVLSIKGRSGGRLRAFR